MPINAQHRKYLFPLVRYLISVVTIPATLLSAHATYFVLCSLLVRFLQGKSKQYTGSIKALINLIQQELKILASV